MGTPAILEAQIRELQDKSRASAAALRTLVAEGEVLEQRLHGKKTLRPFITEIRTEGEALERKLADSSTAVQLVVENVRRLDLAQANTRKALERTEDIMGLKATVDGVASAIVAEDWEKAAQSLQRYIHIAPEGSSSQTEEAALESLRKSLAWLRSIVAEKCQGAIESRDEQGVVRFSRLMTQLGMAGEGASRFAQFMGRKVEQAAEEEVAKLKQRIELGMQGGNQAIYANALTGVLELVAGVMAEGEALGGAELDEEAWLQLVSSLYGKAAPSIANVLGLLYSNKRIGNLVKKYREHGQVEQGSAKELDVLLDELALTLKRLEQFNWFLRRKAMSKSSGEETPQQHAHHTQLLRNNVVEVNKAQLISGYIPLEESFMRHSIEKAIKNSGRDQGEKVSSLVDEVFYILKRCTHRAVQTSSLNAMGDVIMYVNTLLVTTYKEALEQLLSSTDRLGGMQIGGGIAQLFHGTTVGGQVADMSRRQVMDAFDGTSYNNFDVSAGYVAKLHESLGQELRRVFAGGNKKDEEQARECMSELTNANQSLRKSLEEAITRLAGGIERFFGPQLAAFASLDYEMSNGDYGESPAVADLIEAVEATLEPFRGELRPANFDCLVITIVEQIVAPSLEKLVLGRKALCFSLVGAMQFDKDLRALSGFFSGLAQRAVRDRLTRLAQMAIVLNLEDPNEIWEYNWGEQGNVGSGAIVWRLSADEVRRVMERRVDWSKDRISALRL